jgi:alanyl-tRNA synthetase
MALPEILASLAEYVGDDKAKAKEVAQALRDRTGDHAPTLNQVAQLLINHGAGKGKGEVSERQKKLDAELKAAQERVEELEAELETAKSAPTEQVTAIARKLERAEKERDAARSEAAEQKTGRIADKVELSRARFRSSLKGQVDEFGLDALDRRFADRFKPAEDGTVQILDAEGDPIEPPKGKSPEDVLADEALAAVPASNRLRPMNGGGGAGGPGGAAGTITVDQIVAEKQQTREFGTRF